MSGEVIAKFNKCVHQNLQIQRFVNIEDPRVHAWEKACMFVFLTVKVGGKWWWLVQLVLEYLNDYFIFNILPWHIWPKGWNVLCIFFLLMLTIALLHSTFFIGSFFVYIIFLKFQFKHHERFFCRVLKKWIKRKRSASKSNF